jgi:hypothetical protein
MNVIEHKLKILICNYEQNNYIGHVLQLSVIAVLIIRFWLQIKQNFNAIK